MANAPPAPAQREAQKAPTPSHSLDNLQAMMNLVLISSGRFIKAQQAGPDAGRTQFTLKRAVITANERFHDSLDELESEIQQAQTVLRRDLALLKADRKKREAAAKEKEAEKARLAAESTAKKVAPLKKADPPAVVASAKPQPPAPSNKPPTPAADPPALKREMEDPAPPAPPTSAPVEDTHMENADLGNANGPDTEFDFDALFGDTVMHNSGDDADNQDVNMDASGPDLSFTLDESAPSLLRGLEDFAKSSDDDNGGPSNTNGNMDMDFPMNDIPDMARIKSSDQNNTARPADDANVQPPTTNDDMNLDNTATDNLDDLFDLDYENPEATQFDDAFFGFGES